MTNSGNYLFCLNHPLSPKNRMICFPYAGGHHRVFQTLANQLTETEVWVYEPPGHLYTDGEPLKNIHLLCRLYVKQIPQHFFSETALILLGHSFGAYLACEFSNQLSTQYDIKLGLVLCAAHPPSHCKQTPLLCEMPPKALMDRLIEKECLDERLLKAPELMDFFYSALNADLTMYEHFIFPNTIAHLPALIVLGYDDKMVCIEEGFLWKHYFNSCQVECIPGNHLFMNVMESINSFKSAINKHILCAHQTFGAGNSTPRQSMIL